MLRIVFTALAFLVASFQIVVCKSPSEEAFLFNFIIFNIGLWGIASFISDYFRIDKREVKIRQQPRNVLHKGAAFFKLFLGILGILCIWFKGNFWLITVIITSVFMFGYGYYKFRHLEEIAVNKNKLHYYTDFIVSFDLLFPPALIALLVVYKMRM